MLETSEMLVAVGKIYGFSDLQLASNLRRGSLPEARAVFCYMCKVHLPHLKSHVVAKKIKRERSMVSTYNKRINDLLDINDKRVVHNINKIESFLGVTTKIEIDLKWLDDSDLMDLKSMFFKKPKENKTSVALINKEIEKRIMFNK